MPRRSGPSATKELEKAEGEIRRALAGGQGFPGGGAPRLCPRQGDEPGRLPHADTSRGARPARPGRRRQVAQPAWPSGPIRIIAPFPPGGSVDTIARLLVPSLQASLGVPVVVENRSGAAGALGTAAAARAAPDGQTWVLVFDSHATDRCAEPAGRLRCPAGLRPGDAAGDRADAADHAGRPPLADAWPRWSRRRGPGRRRSPMARSAPAAWRT